MREFKSSSIRLSADEFNLIISAIMGYTRDMDRDDDFEGGLLREYDALTDHLFKDYTNPDNYEMYSDPDEESEI